ncbi:MAG: polysaccharide deacetylase family protein [Chthoniobacteraceae bacterium]|nr:polysaccharide deacetylase family protein [Chthoniobacteraceae bacterium]
MKFRLALTALALAAALFTGCDKIKPLFHRASKEAAAAVTPTPTAAPTPKPTATPTPKPTANHSANVIVLCYHRFEGKAGGPYSVSPEEFEQELQAIKDNGFTVISMQDFLAWKRDEKTIPEKSALITIDDGYTSAYEVGWPILKKFDYPFTMFVYVQFIGGAGKSITWDQLAEMRDAGVEIGSHSYTHQNLRGKTPVFSKQAAEEVQRMGYDAWLNKEVVDSKSVIEKQLGIKVSTFSYPYGLHTPQVLDVVKKAGYEAAFTVYGQRIGFSADPILIGRYAVEVAKPKIFHDALGMIGGGMGLGTAASVSAPVVSQTPAANPALNAKPAEGATVSDPKPRIQAVLTSLGTIEPGSVTMRISGFGPVPAQYDEATQTVSYQPTTRPLRDKEYTVFVGAKVAGKRTEVRWSFKFDPAAKK